MPDRMPARPVEGPTEKPLLEKLGVKPGMRVRVLEVDEPWFLDRLRKREVDVSAREAQGRRPDLRPL